MKLRIRNKQYLLVSQKTYPLDNTRLIKIRESPRRKFDDGTGKNAKTRAFFTFSFRGYPSCGNRPSATFHTDWFRYCRMNEDKRNNNCWNRQDIRQGWSYLFRVTEGRHQSFWTAFNQYLLQYGRQSDSNFNSPNRCSRLGRFTEFHLKCTISMGLVFRASFR